MIERQTIAGRPATVAYVDDDMQPTGKSEATLIKVVYDDGETAWLTPPGKKETST